MNDQVLNDWKSLWVSVYLQNIFFLKDGESFKSNKKFLMCFKTYINQIVEDEELECLSKVNYSFKVWHSEKKIKHDQWKMYEPLFLEKRFFTWCESACHTQLERGTVS